MPLLNVDHIHVSYGNGFKALHGVSFDVEKGEIVALLGSNGAGKTTTLKTIAGQLVQSEGKIELEGQDITALPVYERVARGIVMVPEGRRLFPEFTIEENLFAGSFLKANRVNRKENLERVYELFPKVYERRRQLAGTLSGGEQQMVAIARGLMQNPKVLMMDEPSLGLAPIIVEEVFAKIEEISKSGTTILLVEQNVAISLDVASRVFVIETGENVMHGTGAEMKENNDLQRTYLGI